jgi:pimeloyl-ACP methyl ester carboxylesterase
MIELTKKEETLIFLPGASGNIGFWQPVMSLLSERYAKKIIAYPEFGGIPAQSGIRNFDDLQRYVLHSIRHLSEHNTSVVVAQSMGGIFAVQTALQHPQQIKALVLVATSGGVDLSPFYVEDWREDYQLNFSVPDWFVNQHTALDNQLKHIHCPVLLIWGDQDPISPVAVGEYLQSVFRNAQLHIIHQGQHDLAFQYAEQVTHLIDDFIQSI